MHDARRGQTASISVPLNLCNPCWAERWVIGEVSLEESKICRLSPLEGNGFELPVPRDTAKISRPTYDADACFPHRKYGAGKGPRSRSRAGAFRGTDGSNPASSSGEMLWGRRRVSFDPAAVIRSQTRFGETRNELFYCADNLDRLAALVEHQPEATVQRFAPLNDGSARTPTAPLPARRGSLHLLRGDREKAAWASE
jgi:hypothetical protein